MLSRQSYGIAVGEETLDHLEQIYAINTTVSYGPVEQASRVEAARLLMVDIVEIPVDESMSGTLWLFPCAVSRRSLTMMDGLMGRAGF